MVGLSISFVELERHLFWISFLHYDFYIAFSGVSFAHSPDVLYAPGSRTEASSVLPQQVREAAAFTGSHKAVTLNQVDRQLTPLRGERLIQPGLCV